MSDASNLTSKLLPNRSKSCLFSPLEAEKLKPVSDTNLQMAEAVGLSELEWEHLCKLLGRVPSPEELQMIGVMWSEHCAYKSSKPHLKKLITSGSQVLQGPGENAGLVSIDERRAIAFKIESHNHPSFVEPFQGAATGVGGILRDIFTVGARPLALGNYLRFGNLKEAKQKFLLNGVVSGISHYGNCIGIPTLGGQLHTDDSYETNTLVNVFCLGIVDQNKIFLSNTAKPGQSVMVWGAKTGRDGIHGASLLASADFDQEARENKQQKIRVQVGDPFKEKCLMEATLECMNKLSSKIGAIQDMGAAGLTCSTMEIADKSGIGMRLNLDDVPMRETGMQAYELLLSESQERMLACVEKGSEKDFEKILQKWGCEAATIGETTADGLLKLSFAGDQVVNLPASKLVDPPATELPVADLKTAADLFTEAVSEEIEDIKDEWSVLKNILALPRIASKRSIFEKYDSSVGASTVFGPHEAEAAVLLVGDAASPKMGLSFKGACDEALAAIDARFASRYAVTECVRALACVGAKALALTDGINMGNPQTSKVQGALAQSIQGINDAIEVFDTPCVSGNVSLYNQTVSGDKKRDIKPSVFCVLVGRIDDVTKSRPSSFQSAGNEVWLLEAGKNNQSLPQGSLYAREYWKNSLMAKQTPFLDLAAERSLQAALLEAHDAEIFESIRDVTDGGLAVSLVESCFGPDQRFGFEGDWSKTQQRRDQLLFGESGGRVVVEIKPETRAVLMKLGLTHRLQTKRIGTIIEEPIFRLRPLLTGQIDELYQAWSSSFGN